MAGRNGFHRIPIPAITHLYDWGPLDYPSIEAALDDALYLSCESEFPSADVILWADRISGQLSLGLIPRAEGFGIRGCREVMRFRDGEEVYGPAQ